MEIIRAYNAELRGLANYYCLAYDVKHRLSALHYLWQMSLFKTLACKHKTSVNAMVKKLRRGNTWGLPYRVKGKVRLQEIYSLKTLQKKPCRWQSVDKQATTALWTQSRTELLARLNADTCEYCGKTGGYFEVHHVRKLKDLTGKKPWEQTMIAMRRKTIVLCRECHVSLHQGTLPDWKRRKA